MCVDSFLFKQLCDVINIVCKDELLHTGNLTQDLVLSIHWSVFVSSRVSLCQYVQYVLFSAAVRLHLHQLFFCIFVT